MVCGILPYFLSIPCTLAQNMIDKRAFFSPSDYILNNMNSFVYQKIFNLKQFLSILFFEH